MTDTPRLKSAFPRTPHANRGVHATPRRPHTLFQNASAATDAASTVNRSAEVKTTPSDSPFIPRDVIDVPSQRLYALAFYIALNSWRFYEYWKAPDDLDSTWLFLKWLSIDAVFIFGLPSLRIPWLEWAFSTSLAIFMFHALANTFLMFRIPIPFDTWIAGLLKLAYDRELSITERRVKPADILHNSSLILGKQIIHILPEGSALLNPDRLSFCLSDSHPVVNLPIRVNQTTPTLIELLRFDLEAEKNETITITSKVVKQLKRQADKATGDSGPLGPRDLLYPVKKAGVYRLRRVVDESNLEVHRKSHDTAVVTCPKAFMRQSPVHKCKGELSNLTLEIQGTAPLKVKYSRLLNDVDHGVSYQNIQPGNLSPAHANQTLLEKPEFSWAKRQNFHLPLNESLDIEGEWIYTIDEVHDGCGNVVNYTKFTNNDPSLSNDPQSRRFLVHERPQVSFTGCNAQTFLKAAKGDAVILPVHFHQRSIFQSTDTPFKLEYSFNSELKDEKASKPELYDAIMRDTEDKPRVTKPGWYGLLSVSSQFCSGEILEPSSCFLHNPPEPQLSVRKENVYDKCANHSVGLSLDLDLIGTPPFKVRYSVEHSKGIQTKVLAVDSLRGQLELTPAEAGHYRYQFLDISDGVYQSRSLKDKVPILEQTVKPPASARFVGSVSSRKACFGEPIAIDVQFLGESPWELQYELIHNGKRAKFSIESVSETSTLTVDGLKEGGDYTLGLVSVLDRSNCRRSLNEEIKIEARPKRPRAAFGQLDGKRAVYALEKKRVDLPLRLEGEAPWRVAFHNLDHAKPVVVETVLWNENSLMQAESPGRYQLLSVSDATCPGSVDETANFFNVSWIPRPTISAIDGTLLDGLDDFERGEVCEGDEDNMDIQLKGSAPYHVKYEQVFNSGSGSASNSKSLTAALHSASIRMETSRAGEYHYKFMAIGDNLYGPEHRRSPLFTVTQRVHSRPSARFDSPNRIYGFCKEGWDGEETISMTLEGLPPFVMEIGIQHNSNAKTDIISIPNINSHSYSLPVPRRYLDLGQHVITIRKVRDARGCSRTSDYGSSVRIAISDVPTIIPLESKSDYCVGERLSFSLSGHAPFSIFYTFDGVHRKATSRITNFRRIAEAPGVFTITAVSDGASGKCKAHKSITKTIHELPSVKVSRGTTSVVDIHEGGGVDILFEFWGTPPFEFTYTRSSNAAGGSKPRVLETKHDISYEHTKTVHASQEGTYEVVAIKDKFCSFSTLGDKIDARK